jgi:hypothetical protein
MPQSTFCTTVILIKANSHNLFKLKGLDVILHPFRPEGIEYDNDDDNDDNYINYNDYNDDGAKRKG